MVRSNSSATVPSLLIRNKKRHFQVYTQLVTVRLFIDNARNEMSYIALASNAVRSGIVGAYNATGHELEGIGVQGSNGISIYGLHMVSTGLTLEKAKAAGFNATETGFNDLQKPEFIKHDNYEVGIKIVYDKDSSSNPWSSNGIT